MFSEVAVELVSEAVVVRDRVRFELLVLSVALPVLSILSEECDFKTE